MRPKIYQNYYRDRYCQSVVAPRQLVPNWYRYVDHLSAWLKQMNEITCTLDSDADNNVKVRVSTQPLADTDLATWLSAQNNASSRLLPAVLKDNSLLDDQGNVRWRGEMEQYGRDLVSPIA